MAHLNVRHDRKTYLTRIKQLLHLVLGGELTDIDSMEFKDINHIDVVGVFPDYESAEKAWRAKSQQTV